METLTKVTSGSSERLVVPKNHKIDGSNLTLRVCGTALFLLGIAATIGAFALVVKVDTRWGYALPVTFATGAFGILLLKMENELRRQARIAHHFNPSVQ